MIGPARECSKCGHKCHCYSPNCPDCINDVCGTCDCKEIEIAKAESDARSWVSYLK